MTTRAVLPETLRLSLKIRGVEYGVTPLEPDPDVARKAFRLHKHGGDWAVYDIMVDCYGPQCECMGFLRWRRPCKHIRTLQNAGMI